MVEIRIGREPGLKTMAEQDETQESPQPERAKTKAELRKEAAERAEFAKHDGQKILVMHREPCFYSVSTLEEMPGKSTTGQTRYRNHQLELSPGLNDVPKTLFDIQMSNVRFEKKVADGRIEVIKSWGTTRVIKLIPMITDSADVKVLKRLLEEEKREDVKDALEDHIAECEDTSGQGQAARRAQRSHNRGQPRRRKR